MTYERSRLGRQGRANVPIAPRLQARATQGQAVKAPAPGRWRLDVIAGPCGRYRLAQLDDYARVRRRQLLWRPPLRLSLRARVSRAGLPGTWGFGLWNDPFAMSMGLAGSARRLPVLPQASWFFYASPQNHLALRDTFPANGFLASSFRSVHLPAAVFALGIPTLPLLAWPLAARQIRRLARRLVEDYASRLAVDPADWHGYSLEWRRDAVRFFVDDALVAETRVSPRPPLGLVLWIDNQYAAFPPSGRVAFGRLPNPEAAWLELTRVEIRIL